MSVAVDILADLREAGMTDAHIARVLGLRSPRQVSAWRRGENSPYPYTLQRLADLHSHLTAWEPRPSVMPVA